MGRRANSFNDDDLGQIQGLCETAIADALNQAGVPLEDRAPAGAETIANLAGVFRVREKVLAMKGKTNGAPKVTRPRTVKPPARVSAPEVEV